MTENTRTPAIRELTQEEIAAVAGGSISSNNNNAFAGTFCLGLGFLGYTTAPVSQVVSILLGLNCGCRMVV